MRLNERLRSLTPIVVLGALALFGCKDIDIDDNVAATATPEVGASSCGVSPGSCAWGVDQIACSGYD